MNWNGLLQDLLYAVITVMLPILTKHAVDWFKTLKANSNNALLNTYITQAQDIIANVVVSVNQTYVETLKKSGNFTAEAQTEAFNMAKNTASKLITDNIKTAIESMYGNLDTYIETAIESAVNTNKGGKN